ncbi:cytochrome ubiquinol oxidase subunit I, partial [Streptomyces sp.]
MQCASGSRLAGAWWQADRTLGETRCPTGKPVADLGHSTGSIGRSSSECGHCRYERSTFATSCRRVRTRTVALNLLDLSRWQFALTVMFHMTFPAITVGLSILLSVL